MQLAVGVEGNVVIRELTQEELEGLLTFNHKACALFLYTPFCGTCNLAARMLDIVQASLPKVPIYKMNINLAPDIAERWEIESIPCVLIVHQGVVLNKVYALHSVAELYELLYPLQHDG